MATLFETLTNAGLPVISAEENGAVQMGAMTPIQQVMYDDILFQYFHPTEYAEWQITKADMQQIRDLYGAMMNRLGDIENAGTIPFTQQGFTLVVNAVKDEATFQKRILKALKILIGK